MPFPQLPPFQTIAPELLELATPEERAAYAKALKRHTALQSPLDFALQVSPRSQEYATVRLLNAVIVALVEGRLYKSGIGPVAVPDEDGVLVHPETGERMLRQLFVTKPPRHGKSYLVSEHTPGWFEARYPDLSVIFSSYSDTFAAKYGRRNRDHFADPAVADLFNVTLNKDVSAQDEWEFTKTLGGMKTAGAGSSITGRGGHLLICDDPIKNQEEALSETDREKKWDWWFSTFLTRGEPGAVVILVHTRWHEDDLGGRLMREEGHLWFELHLPALQPEDPDGLQDTALHSGSKNPLARKAGEALVPERYSRLELERLREQSPRWFSALYQGRPTTTGGGIFNADNYRYWRPDRRGDYVLQLPGGGYKLVSRESCYHFQTIDLAASVKTYSDWTVISTWAATPDRELLLVDRLRRRMESADHKAVFTRNVEDLARQGIKVRMAGVEKATYGLSLYQKLRRERICPIKPLAADKDKVTRNLVGGQAVDEGIVYWPREAPWLEEWEEEHNQFPFGAHDDQVDTTGYAAHLIYFSGLAFKFTAKEPEKTDMQSRLERHMEKLDRKKGAQQHPVLGRIR